MTPPTSATPNPAVEAARRIVEYWRVRGVTDPAKAGGRNIDELSVALALLAAVEALEEWLNAFEQIQQGGQFHDTPRCLKARIAARAALSPGETNEHHGERKS